MRFNPNIVGGTLIGIGVLAIMAAGPLSVWLGSDATSRPSNRKETIPCRVLDVYDGDTFSCDLNGNGRIDKPHEHIRLLGVDSPEMHYSRKNSTYGSAQPQDEPFAPQASQWLTERIHHRMVYLEYDHQQQDRYGRTLAYVYTQPLETRSLNQQLLEAGLSRTLFIGKNRRYETAFRQAEHAARQAGKHIWQQQPAKTVDAPDSPTQ